MYTIRKEFAFSASHCLGGLAEDHPCSRVHGHNYVVTVELQAGALDKVGMVVDYRKLEPIKKYIDEELDHRHLNDVVDFNPTAENLAHFLYYKFNLQFPWLVSVTVSETPKTMAKYDLEVSD